MKSLDAEALQIIYDPSKITYQQLLEFLYKMHDPTTADRQGFDFGPQYRSGIFYHNAEQETIARDVSKRINEQWWDGKVLTEILPAGQWWDAEDYHQKYLDVNPDGEFESCFIIEEGEADTIIQGMNVQVTS